ncbi:hypothetical protein CsSME_00041125 [Camellia sinensis var. sinensis]
MSFKGHIVAVEECLDSGDGFVLSPSWGRRISLWAEKGPSVDLQCRRGRVAPEMRRISTG